MQLKNLLVAAWMTLPAIAGSINSTNIAPKLQTRLAEIDIGCKSTYLKLNQVVNGRGNTTIDDVVFCYKSTAAAEDSALDKNQPTMALSNSSQLVLC